MELNKFYNKAYDWILTFGPRLLIAIIILAIGFWLIRLLKRWMNSRWKHKDVDPSIKTFLSSLVITLLQVLLILGAMQLLGVQMTIFAAIVGGVGVAAGLALSGTLQNFTSGILILLLKPYKVGDNILAQGLEGAVSSIRLFYTVVTTFDNRTVIIPNSKLSNEIIINLSREGTRRLDIELKFSFAYDIKQIREILTRTLSSSTDTLQEPAFRIGVTQIDPDGYKLMVNVWTKAHGFNDTKMALQQKLIDDLKTAGIKLPGM